MAFLLGVLCLPIATHQLLAVVWHGSVLAAGAAAGEIGMSALYALAWRTQLDEWLAERQRTSIVQRDREALAGKLAALEAAPPLRRWAAGAEPLTPLS